MQQQVDQKVDEIRHKTKFEALKLVLTSRLHVLREKPFELFKRYEHGDVPGSKPHE
jgi:hypothetical protein